MLNGVGQSGCGNNVTQVKRLTQHLQIQTYIHGYYIGKNLHDKVFLFDNFIVESLFEFISLNVVFFTTMAIHISGREFRGRII